MQIVDLKQNSAAWSEFRKGKIRGSNVIDIWQANTYTKDDIVLLLQTKKVEFKKSAKKGDLELLLTEEDKAILAATAERKIGFYNIIAEKLAQPADMEERRDRGHRLEAYAAQRFAEDYDLSLELVGCCVSDIDDRIINSPDRLVTPKKGKDYTAMVEIKCLSSSRHLQAMVENKVPEEFFTQKVQYFVVNEKLEKLYFVFYDDRFKYRNLQLHVIEVTRESLGHWPETMLKYQLAQLKDMDEIIERLAF